MPAGLRYAGVVLGVVLLGYVVVAVLPFAGDAFADDRAAGLTLGAVLWNVLVRVPFGTVLLEEVAFRGVLYGMVARRHGYRRATVASSLLFGLWHVLPSLGLRENNAAVGTAAATIAGSGTAGQVGSVLAAVVVTALAGVAFCELRRRSGSLLAPATLHWALNGLGYGFAWVLSGSITG